MVMRGVVGLLAKHPSALPLGLQYFGVRKALGVDARLQALRLLGATIGNEVYIGARVYVRRPSNLTVGDGTSLSGMIRIESWKPVTFGADIIVGGDALFLTAGHDVDSPDFAARSEAITVGDHAWLTQHIIVLPGVNLDRAVAV